MKCDFAGWATKNDLLCTDGRTIRRDAFKDCDGMTVPLVYQHDHNDPTNVLGHCLLENRDKGVYCYGFFNNTEKGQHAKESVNNGDITSLSIYANHLKQQAGDVLHGMIREVSLVMTGANPGARIETVLGHAEEFDEEGAALTLYEDGSDYSGHAGGVCATEDDIYISNAHHLYRISLERFRSLPEESRCAFEEEIPVPVNASFCSYAEGVLWVGEFQYTGDYPTDPSHAVRGKDGVQRAWICGYRMEGRTDFGTPDCILSVTERIQGMTTRDGAIYLSQSYGRRADSVIMRYDGVLERAPDTSAVLDGLEIPLWILDSDCRSGALLCPPMTECLCTVGDEVYVLFESAAQPYMDPKKPSLNPIDRAFILQGF